MPNEPLAEEFSDAIALVGVSLPDAPRGDDGLTYLNERLLALDLDEARGTLHAMTGLVSALLGIYARGQEREVLQQIAIGIAQSRLEE